MSINKCIFCKIIRKELPSFTVFEDENTLAILDINPINRGHILVIPKSHVEKLREMNEESKLQLFKTVTKMERIISEMPDCKGTNLIQNNGKSAGQMINHVHFHVIPRYEGDTFRFSYEKHTLTEEELEKNAEQLRKKVLEQKKKI